MKDIKNYEGHYQINEEGEIFSLKYKKVKLKPSISRAGYPQVILSRNGKAKCEFIHILLAETFLNHEKNNGLIVDHKDNVKTNCYLSNIQITDKRENRSKENKRICKSRGVVFYPRTNKFRSQISINGKQTHLGYFNTEDEASRVYENKLLTLKS